MRVIEFEERTRLVVKAFAILLKQFGLNALESDRLSVAGAHTFAGYKKLLDSHVRTHLDMTCLIGNTKSTFSDDALDSVTFGENSSYC